MEFKTTFSQSILQKLWFIYSQRIHKFLIHKSSNFYLKPNDIISYRPTLFGYHEAHIEKLIQEGSESYNGFFLDLGANVGLTSALVGNRFKSIDCVEPNELVFNILKTNLALHLVPETYHCHMIGLGKKDEELKLLVPKDNFGGAFIESGNDIVDIKKAEAANNKHFDKDNFAEIKITVRNAESWLGNYFSELQKDGLTSGIIKIDVEGYEGLIFERILKTLPENFYALIIMENWFDRFPIEKFASSSHDFKWFYFRKIKRIFHSIPFKILGLSSSYRLELHPLTGKTAQPHDVICLLSSKSR